MFYELLVGLQLRCIEAHGLAPPLRLLELLGVPGDLEKRLRRRFSYAFRWFLADFKAISSVSPAFSSSKRSKRCLCGGQLVPHELFGKLRLQHLTEKLRNRAVFIRSPLFLA